MACVESGRWTCPDCGRSLTVYGSEPDCRAAIRAAQKRHGDGHRAWRGRNPMPRSKPKTTEEQV